MKRLTKLLAVLLAVLLPLAGCQSDTSWVYSYSGGRTIPAGLYIYLQMQSFSEAFSALYQEEMDEYLATLSATPTDAEASAAPEEAKSVYDMEYDEILAQQVEDVPVSQWVDKNSDTLARRFMTAQVKLEELGKSLTEEQLALYKNTARQAFASAAYSYDATGNPISGEKYFTGMGVSESSLALAYQYSDTLALHFEALYGKGGELEVPEDEILAYFKDNFVRGQQIVMAKPTEDDMPQILNPGEGELDEDAQAAVDLIAEQNETALVAMEAELKALADSLYGRMQAGEAIEELTLEYDKYNSADGTAEIKETGSLDFIVLNDDYSAYGQEVVDGLAALEPGKSSLIENDTSFILIRRLDLMEKPEDLEAHRLGLLIDLRYESDYLPKLDAWAAELPVTVNENAISRYVSGKLKMGM
ncbi:MAG: peptidyl-prolyl cis-trans isomerase [Oscillospiraceae bacterium]|jgi:hypothetical protein|nr:peptidyl-prolyl cis-trans isomerase [Oscillospiraceae bacterium]